MHTHKQFVCSRDQTEACLLVSIGMQILSSYIIATIIQS